jgi:hypothetical protein
VDASSMGFSPIIDDNKVSKKSGYTGNPTHVILSQRAG